MKYEKIFILITTLCYGIYIFSYPPSFYNDDSLFLTRGIEHFSVIDFSPHFPGYPALIIMGKFINLFLHDAKMSLFILSASCAILTPAVVFLLVENILNKKAAIISFVLTLSSPYLLNLSLTMLSDSIGLFFFFVGLYFFQINKDKTSGIIFSIALFSRPAYLILFIVGFIYLMFYKKNSIKNIFIFFMIGMIFFLSFIYINEGLLYLIEAKRFLLGHFTLWGTGQNSNATWFSNIFIFSNMLYILLILCFFNYNKNLKLYYSFFIVYLFWIIFAQNPDNLRHLIPLIFIANILLSSVINKHTVLFTFCFLILNIHSHLGYSNTLSPIENIIKDIKDKNRVIITNRGIEILRKYQENPVIDKYYTNSTTFYTHYNKTITITTSKPKNKKHKIYNGRFIGDHTYYLYK